MGEQALSIVKQAVDLALAAGVYKSTQDVVLIHNALTNLKELVDSDKKAKEDNLLKCETPIKESEAIKPKK